MKLYDVIKARWTGEFPLYVVALTWAGVALYLTHQAGMKFSWGGVRTNGVLIFAAVLFYSCLYLLFSLARHRPESPIGYFRERFLSRKSFSWWIAALPIVGVCVVLLPLFSNMKGMIPYFTDYTWDATFIAWDRALFFGYDPWQVLWPIFGNPYVTAIMAVFYHLWILLLYLGCVMVLFDPRVDRELRRQFFMSYVLIWALLGSIMATALASVGPVFAAPLIGIDTFEPQMALLRQNSETAYLMTLPVQEGLLNAFQERARGLGAGITAMPSLHVAIAFLFVLTTRQLDRRLYYAFIAFFAIIWIGSVHLAYHYAVDGLVSVIGVIVIWLASAAILRWWDALLAGRDQPADFRTNTVPAE